MATAVCRGLQSCLDTHLVQEPMTTLTLRLFSPMAPANHSFAHSLLDLTSSSPPHSHPLNTTPQQLLGDPRHYHNHHPHHHHQHPHPISSSSSSNPNMGMGLGGWSFLQALSTTNCQEPSRPDQEPPVYVHPLARASSLRLSPRSLELCTENLGSESSNIVAFDDDNDDGDPNYESKSATREQTAPRPWSTRQITDVENASKKAKPRTNINNSNSNSFPPPLTTIANDSIRVRPHREEGRLIIEAMRAPQSNRSCFHADRSHGRLRLCFFKDTSLLSFDSAEQDDGGEKGVEGRTDGNTESETTENDVLEEDEDEEVGEELSMINEEEEEETEQDGDWDDWEEKEAMEGAPEIVGDQPGMEKLRHRHHHHHHHHQRPSWCKEGGNEHESEKRLLNWKAYLVATS